jgi:hypothetical protein
MSLTVIVGSRLKVIDFTLCAFFIIHNHLIPWESPGRQLFGPICSASVFAGSPVEYQLYESLQDSLSSFSTLSTQPKSTPEREIGGCGNTSEHSVRFLFCKA